MRYVGDPVPKIVPYSLPAFAKRSLRGKYACQSRSRVVGCRVGMPRAWRRRGARPRRRCRSRRTRCSGSSQLRRLYRERRSDEGVRAHGAALGTAHRRPIVERDRVLGNKLFLYTQKTGAPVFVPPPAVVKALEDDSKSKYFFAAAKPQTRGGRLVKSFPSVTWRRARPSLWTGCRRNRDMSRE